MVECENAEEEPSPTVTHLALVCAEIALAKYWASLGVKPSVVIGHSLGGYAALHIAGVIPPVILSSLLGDVQGCSRTPAP